jgi:hypothetical protein
MYVLNTGGKVYGAKLTAAEKKAMDIEIRKQLAEDLIKHEDEVDAIVLYALGQEFGWGATRMRRLWEIVHNGYRELCKRYEMDPTEDGPWLIQYKLKKEKGVDIVAWNAEKYQLDK